MEYRLSISDELVYVNEYSYGEEHVVAICDKELLGKTLVEGERRFYVDPNFYGGRLVSIREAIRLLEVCSIANLVGEKIVSAAIKHGFVHPEAVITIDGVPHAQIIRM